jgi:L,D-transpeptidase YcbB
MSWTSRPAPAPVRPHPFRPLAGRGLTGVVTALLLALPALPADARAERTQAEPGAELADLIRTRIESRAASSAPFIRVEGERIHAADELPRFYQRRGHRPAWVDLFGPGPLSDSVITAVERAALEGLNPEHYHLARMREIQAELRRDLRAGRIPDRQRLADLDLLLTDAFLVYGSHLVGGRVDPLLMHPEWSAAGREVDMVALLEGAVDSGRVGETLESLLPVHPGYGRLRQALAEYRRIAERGGWPEIPGRSLQEGDRDPAVRLVRQRLRATRDLVAPLASDETLFDAELADAVRRFQRRHAIRDDGILGLETSGYLNVPVAQRVRQLELNLERWRWLPRDLGERHIIVNIAGYQMDVMVGDSSVFQSRAMVGQRYRRTPVFSGRMTYLVLNPTWTIPPGILEEDKLPLIRRDPNYLRDHHIRVLRHDGREVDPATIDFNRVTRSTGYMFRMDPWAENPLGQVKFMFPNEHHIYLHDTPEREEFGRTSLAFSSGCIRIENSLEFAEYLLGGWQGWTGDRIRAAIAAGRVDHTIILPQPVPVHLLYWTSWVDRDGTVHFRRDVYDRDHPLDEALRWPAPETTTAGS